MSTASLSVILILISAITHALVGAIMKRSDDKLMLRGILGLVALAARPAGALDNGLGLAGPAMGWCVLPVARPSAATCKEGIADRAK